MTFWQGTLESRPRSTMGLSFSSMPASRKGADLCRDPRFALHSATIDPVAGAEADWPGEAKIAGRAIFARGTAPEGDLSGSLPRSTASCTRISMRLPSCLSSSGGRGWAARSGSSVSDGQADLRAPCAGAEVSVPRV